MFKKASQNLGSQLVHYQCRHCGASTDRATKFRSLAEVKRRGGRKQDKSVHGTRTVHGDAYEKRFEDILIHGRAIAPPVGLGVEVLCR